MGAVGNISAVFVLALSAFIYSRWSILPTFVLNAPGRLAQVNTLKDYEVKFQNVVRNCEDIYLSEKGQWALLSCDPGRDLWNTVMGVFVSSVAPVETGLYLYKYGEGGDATPAKIHLEPFKAHRDTFHPLGIEYHEDSETLFIINHSPEGSRVQWYALDAAAGVAAFEGGLSHPSDLPSPNSLAALSGTEVFITNDHKIPARKNFVLGKVETYSGYPGGSVAFLKRHENGSTSVKTLARVPFANGIVLLNSTRLAVASSNTGSVRFFDITWQLDGSPALSYTSSIAVPFLPDNVSLDSRGKLLIAGHPHAPSLEKVAKNNRFCEGRAECALPKLSWVAEWSEEDGLKTLYSGSDFGTSTTAVRDWQAGIGLVTGLYERGLLTWSL
ncbi:Putative six-bladed beta-propeller, TolB [Septoria linicola]|uniref:Six-bladed beta-propeller, TolB n=1 Tax=Septoria linicola TaxID=215465 RepID=A0A9Q9ANA4_9PEZI|nr:Putative six-bladed beta-propeller, TolB [Septoria linicola]